MGFYLRKSLSVGPLRFNLSKSGIGLSAGIKGFRVGTGPRGNYVHMGIGGIYFRQALPPPHSTPSVPSGKRPSEQMIPPDSATVEAMHEIESGSVLEMIDSSSAQLLQELNSKRKKLRL